MKQKTRVAILGGGFAGLAVARELERRNARSRCDVTLVNAENYTLYTPMLPEVATGSIESRHIVEPIRAALKSTRFIMGEVESIDLRGRSVRVRRPLNGVSEDIRFDQLVLALGATTSTLGVPGVAQHTIALKTLDDGIRLRNEVIKTLETAATTDSEPERERLLTFVIVGGGFTGVEAAGELLAFLHDIKRFYPSLKSIAARVVLIEAADQLLPQLPTKFGNAAKGQLQRRTIEVVTGEKVASADPRGIQLKSGKRYDAQVVVWSAGVKPSPTVGVLPVKLSRHGAVVVNRDLSVPEQVGVWALGDCAHIPKRNGGFYPPTAQHALREGQLLARNILATQSKRRTKPFVYRSPGMMASLGNRSALADVFGRLVKGLPAWFLWRTYYLARLPGADRKARVASDWALALIFPRDIAQLRLGGNHLSSTAGAKTEPKVVKETMDSRRLSGKVAIVTGAATGIGRAIAKQLAKDGAMVTVDYIGSPVKANDVIAEIEKDGGKGLAIEADVSNPDQVNALVYQTVAKFGKLDVLVNNAGLEDKQPFLETSFATWQKVIAVDLTGPWVCSQAAARQMVLQGNGGRIINISSVHEDMAMPTNAPYCAAKGGLRMLMRTLAVELGPHNINVTNVAPGAIDTPMDQPLEQHPDEMKALLSEIPLNRMGKPQDIAGMVAFLASDEARYITGSTFFVDGGMMRQSGSL
ncbi:MAG: SDR family oxidoreductase [Candidatus Eremiobacteraeota bacterium]|nr:SDR family oxidoreductase [Candidatus Eremiobacteraeota bacterium]